MYMSNFFKFSLIQKLLQFKDLKSVIFDPFEKGEMSVSCGSDFTDSTHVRYSCLHM